MGDLSYVKDVKSKSQSQERGPELPLCFSMVYRLTKRPLFGGAIDIDVPCAWRDVSEVRQVPDHQE